MGVNHFGPTTIGNKKQIQLGNNYFMRKKVLYGVADVIPIGLVVALNTSTGKYIPLALTGSDGQTEPVGIITDPRIFSTTSEELTCSIVTAGRILADNIVYPSGATAAQKEIINQQLTSLGMELEFAK